MKTALRPLRLFVAAAVILSLAAFVLATSASATHGQPGKQLPFQGMWAGPASGQEFAPGFPNERSTFDGRCSVPSDYVISWDGLTGKATHLGSLTVVEASHCSQFDPASGVIPFGDGVFTLMAANGDTVTGTYGNGLSSFQPDGTITYTYELTIAGGTGRFAGATGDAAVSGTVVEFDMTVMPWKVTVVEVFDGWIAYDASQRSGP
jgi:hypothetical protein